MQRSLAKQSIPFPILLIIAATTVLLGYTTIARAETQSITLLGIEVTQGLQSMSEAEPRDSSQDNLIPLIKNRKTLIRVYFDQPGQYRIKLKVSNSEEEPGTLLCSKNNGRHVAGLTNRSDLKSSLYFEVPDKLLKGEQIIIQSITLVNPKNKPRTSFTCSNCSTYRPPAYPLTEGAPLKLRLIGLSYTNGGPTPHAPEELEFLKILSWLRRTYPITEVLTFPRRGPDSPVSDVIPYDITQGDLFRPQGGCYGTNEQLRLLKQADHDANQNNEAERQRIAQTRYVAILSDRGFPPGQFVRGCTNGDPNTNPDLMTTAPIGNTETRYEWDDDQFYGDWQIAHELGHTFGRSHPILPDACGATEFTERIDTRVSPAPLTQPQYVGLDFGDSITPADSNHTTKLKQRAIRGDWHDFMSYCPRSSPGVSVSKWITPDTYKGILTALAQNNTPVMGVVSQAELSHEGGESGPPSSTLLLAGKSNRQDSLTPGPITTQNVRFVTALATINLSTKSGTLNYVRENSIVRGRPSLDHSAVELRITFRQGNFIVKPMAFQLYPDAYSKSQEIGSAAVDIPLMSEGKPIEETPTKIELLIKGTVADTIIPLSHPRLKVFQPSYLQTEQADQSVQLTWKADLPDEPPSPNDNPLTYTVQISYDKGESWHTIAINIKDTLKEQSFDLLLDRIKGENDVQVKVIATDRYNNTEKIVTIPRVGVQPDKPSTY